ncbi:23S rRNA (uracil(1939)-C(5))-methyltransferase RlmD [Desulfoferula mesophila]|uniref:23S rRNA (Uracil(1939)-C(5))-methyltransferase RlmD n=1 Tax=Desulfoferula mesophila TaxID=3058419 RepID=A0AAU9EE18_9BACT|nr:23S rRNA (uracil(1939)-C(5))-methyltransferase RlmD [Desulfoferula mesophilus]
MTLQDPAQPGQEMTLTVEDLASGGDGLAHEASGRVVFVPGALPGEKVRARLVEAKRDFGRAELLVVDEASPQRVEPACPLFGECGGCQMQHLEYEAQVQAKAGWVSRALARLGDLPPLKSVPSPQVWGWRHRVRLSVGPEGLGFLAAASQRVVPVTSCPVAAPEVNRLLPGLAQGLAQMDTSHLTYLEVLGGEERSLVTVGLDRGRPLSNRWRGELRRLCRGAGAAATRLEQAGRVEPWERTAENGVDYWREEGLTLSAYPGEFVQANFGANRELIGLVRRAAAGASEGGALELYAGGGNFTLPLAHDGRAVLAVEGDPESYASAKALARREGLAAKVELMAGEAATATAKLVAQKRGFAMALLDPPRSGAKGVMPALAALAPKRIIYISCHPAALARDAAVLLEAGYAMQSLAVVDMFPHTGHTEALLVLDRP